MSGSAEAPQGTRRAGAAAARLRARLAEAGFDRVGVVSRSAWDACVPEALRAERLLPEARVAWILGSGGGRLAEALERASGTRLPAPGDPLDAYTEARVAEVAAALEAAGSRVRPVLAHRPEAGAYADLVALGRAAGLGWPSRLGLLLHPEVGPWLSLRAALLVDRPGSAAAPLPGDGPCAGCPAPCARACPGAALPEVGFDVAACARHRRRDPACALACAARRACVVGPGHRYAEGTEAHHMAAAGRALGVGLPGSQPGAGPPGDRRPPVAGRIPETD